MRSVLENIFNPPDTSAKLTTVQKRISPSKYEVVDDVGRTTLVDSDFLNISPGKRVVVQLGRIISIVGKSEVVKNYRV